MVGGCTRDVMCNTHLKVSGEPNNKVCELKLLSLYNDHICKLQLCKEMENTTASIPSTHKEHIHTLFSSMSDRITYKIVKEYKGKDNILKCDLKAFVRV